MHPTLRSELWVEGRSETIYITDPGFVAVTLPAYHVGLRYLSPLLERTLSVARQVQQDRCPLGAAALTAREDLCSLSENRRPGNSPYSYRHDSFQGMGPSLFLLR